MPTRLARALFTAMMVCLACAATAAEGGIKWFTNFDEAKAAAAKEQKLIFTDMYADWCPPCKMLESTTFVDEGVIKLMGEFIALKVDADKEPDFLEKYSDGSLPTLAMLDAEGRLLASTTGYMDAAQMQDWIKAARDAGKELEALEKSVKEDPSNGVGALSLASRYVEMRDGAKALATLNAIPADAAAAFSAEQQADLLYTRGIAHYTAEDYDAAIPALQEFMQKHEGDPRSADLGGTVLESKYLSARNAVKQGNLEKARQVYTDLAAYTALPELAQHAQLQLDIVNMHGKPAPAMDIAEWVGPAVDLKALQGKVVLLNFFQVLDPFQEQAGPAVAEIGRIYGGGDLAIAGIAYALYEPDQQKPEAIKEYVQQKAVPYPVGIDNNQTNTFKAYRGMSASWVAIIDKQGNIVYLDEFDIDRILAKLEALLGA